MTTATRPPGQPLDEVGLPERAARGRAAARSAGRPGRAAAPRSPGAAARRAGRDRRCRSPGRPPTPDSPGGPGPPPPAAGSAARAGAAPRPARPAPRRPPAGASRTSTPADVHRGVRVPPGRGTTRPVVRQPLDHRSPSAGRAHATAAARHATQRTVSRLAGTATASAPAAGSGTPARSAAIDRSAARSGDVGRHLGERPAGGERRVGRPPVGGEEEADVPAGEALERLGDLRSRIARHRPPAHLVDHQDRLDVRQHLPQLAERRGCCAAAPPGRPR